MLPERSFTRRETEIILLAAEGYSNHEIARELLIAEEMVKGYMKELREKLAVRNRTHAVALALRSGIVPMDDTTWSGSRPSKGNAIP